MAYGLNLHIEMCFLNELCKQCDQMARLFAQYLVIHGTQNLYNSIKMP